MSRFSSVVLVDPRGWILLQERDEHPEVDPDKWGFVGGGLEAGEDYEAAAHRELAEETGLHDQRLERFGVFEVFHDNDQAWHEFALWVGRTTAADDDIVLGEGRRIVFVDPSEVAGLDLTASAQVALGRFLDSASYRTLSASP